MINLFKASLQQIQKYACEFNQICINLALLETNNNVKMNIFQSDCNQYEVMQKVTILQF